MVETSGYEKSARFYDLFETVPCEAFFETVAERSDVVLDVGAGTGQVSVVLANAGTRVVAVEPSNAMRTVFREKLANSQRLGDRITILPESAQSFSWDGTADAAVMRGVFEHLLTAEERMNTLENVAAHLDTGGRFVFNATVWDFDGNELTEADVEERGNRRYERHVARDVNGDDLDVRWVYRVFENDELIEQVEQPSTKLRSDPDDVRGLTEAAGFRIVDERSMFNYEPFRPDESFWLVLDTRKR